MAVSKSARAQEFSRYFFALHPAGTSRSPKAVSSHDNALTAFAQLGALRLNVRRAIISLFDAHMQYVIAEATQTLSLRCDDTHKSNDQLLLGVSTISKLESPCALTLDVASYESIVHIPDLSKEARFHTSPYRLRHPGVRFFTAAPIISPKDVVIGTYAVMHDDTRLPPNDVEVEFLRDMAETVGKHLVARRAQEEHRHGEKSLRGMGSFTEGLASIRNWRPGRLEGERHHEELRTHAGGEGQLDTQQQEVQRKLDRSISYRRLETRNEANRAAPGPSPPLRMQSSPATSLAPQLEQQETLQESLIAPDVKAAFSRAANLVRESMEVHGAMFLDARLNSYGSLVYKSDQSTKKIGTSSLKSSSEDNLDTPSSSDSPVSDSGIDHKRGKFCGLLGFATSEQSSINRHAPNQNIPKVSEKLLQTLFSRYPKGKIFHLTDDGFIASSSSDDKDNLPLQLPSEHPNGSVVTPSNGRHRKKKGLAEHDSKVLLDMFRGSRSLLFVPIWDYHRQRWFSGCFVWTALESRTFTPEGDLQYLAMFGSVIMAEVARLDALTSEKAKSELLGSISHELRSPLHGILACLEMLDDSEATNFQNDMYQTMRNCGTSLLDVVDHLLDYTKINHSSSGSKQQKRPLMNSKDAPGPDLFSYSLGNYLDFTTEETIDVAILGHYAQNHNQYYYLRSERQGNQQGKLDKLGEIGELMLILDVDKSINRSLPIRTGPWRQVLLNIFTNSLKYTEHGFVKVSLAFQQSTRRALSKLMLTVTDSGRGMSKEFIQDRLFTPFAQENYLTPGTGLGLSILKKIVSSCGGKIAVQSTRGEGTRIAVSIPIKQNDTSKAASPSEDHHELERTAKRCSSLVYIIIGLDNSSQEMPSYQPKIPAAGRRASVQALKATLDKLCQSWFELRNVADLKERPAVPDIYLAVETSWNSPSFHSGDIFNDIPRCSEQASGVPSPMLVVLCKSAASASVMSRKVAEGVMAGLIVEYISQPCGPRKLSRAISSCLDRRQTASVTNDLHAQQQQKQEQKLPTALKSQKSRALRVSASDQEYQKPSHPDPLTQKQHGPVQQPRYPLSDAESMTSGPQNSGAMDSLSSFGPFLIVDDNLINVRVLEMYLKKQKIEYSTAKDGKQALEFFRENRKKCRTVIMDIQMPVMDGLESVRLMRAFEKEQGIGLTAGRRRSEHHMNDAENAGKSTGPVEKGSSKALIIMLTGIGSANVRTETLASGADGFWMKPLKFGNMEDKLKALARGDSTTQDTNSAAEKTVAKDD